jgi:predicted metalloprotease with PDZ domain
LIITILLAHYLSDSRMRLRIFLLFFVLTSAGLFAQNKYLITLDLNNISNDRVKVTLVPPHINDREIRYIMPSFIPGSYFKKDFGRFISDMLVITKAGNSLDIKKEGENVFVIKNKNAEEIAKIEYFISDSWDMEKPTPSMTDEEFNYVFQPGGTNVAAGQNVLINHYGYFGYIDGYKDLPYELLIQKPPQFYASTTLARRKGSSTKDYFMAENYTKLVDNPIMYCVPDTTSFNIDSTHISLSVYSENGIVKAKALTYYLIMLSSAVRDNLGRLPVKQYSYIMYFASPNNLSITKYGGFGAMEHNYCSFYFLPEISRADSLDGILKQFIPHNFMHILTPLNIHSEKLDEFDYKHVPQSKHLWLYEGVTEYLADLVQVKDSIMSQDEFMEIFHEKMDRSSSYPDVSLTEMSKDLNKKINRDAYMNVFDRGAVTALLMDARLMELSKGKMGLRDVLLKLSETYGPNKSFKDDSLFDVIAKISFPEMKTFFDDYLIANKPLPYKEYFNKMGMNYFPTRIDTVWSFGKFTMAVDQVKDELIILKVVPGNLFGLQKGDFLVSVNNIPLTLFNFELVMEPIYTAKNGDKVKLSYRRGTEIITKDATPRSIVEKLTNVITANDDATEAQKAFREKLLGSSTNKH